MSMKVSVGVFSVKLILWGNLGLIRAICLTSDSKYLISGSLEKEIKVHSLISRQLVHVFKDAHRGKDDPSLFLNAVFTKNQKWCSGSFGPVTTASSSAAQRIQLSKSLICRKCNRNSLSS